MKTKAIRLSYWMTALPFGLLALLATDRSYAATIIVDSTSARARRARAT